MIDLWPDEFGPFSSPPPPILTLKEQASIISNKTGGRIVAAIYSESHDKDFAYRFMLVAPFLGDYEYELFVVSHPIELYPLEIDADVMAKQFKCKTPEQFQAALRTIFSSPQTSKVIRGILAQTDAMRA